MTELAAIIETMAPEDDPRRPVWEAICVFFTVPAIATMAKLMPDEGRALFVDSVLPDVPQPTFGFLGDMQMFALFGDGGARTFSEYQALMVGADLKIERIERLSGPASLIIARPTN